MSKLGNSKAPSENPSHVIDYANPSIFKPKYLVLDDINVDLLSFNILAASGLAYLFSYLDAKLAAAIAATILPLRLIFPRSKAPTGTKVYDIVTKEKQLTVNVLVNGAALGAAGDPFEQPVELVERMTTLNCISLVQLAHLFGNDMIKRGIGWMMHISSVGSYISSPGQNIYHSTKYFVRAFSEALSVELRAYPGIVNTLLLPGPAETQFVTRSHAQETVMMAASGAVEDPKSVAQVGYKALCKGKRESFSSWNAMFTSLVFSVVPKSVHLTMASVFNLPFRGRLRAREPLGDQRVRGQTL
ncbi:SDR family NAD(P)-dependent oxidoreductase [Aspergillus foveolatus]|uniref:SDR family NAD(P)-dependent oxidoreductase n=1 Tax=Aspergillus foveolatus TaxID=210207 RepID=UPI003CCCB2CE